jgi:hypothetical protein
MGRYQKRGGGSYADFSGSRIQPRGQSQIERRPCIEAFACGYDIALIHTIGLLGVAVLVAIVARRLSLPYTVGLVLTGVSLALMRLETGEMLTHDFIFDVVLPPLLF